MSDYCQYVFPFFMQTYTRHGRTTLRFFPPDDERSIPPSTMEEIAREIQQLKNNKCKDCAGLVAEVLKNGGSILTGILCGTVALSIRYCRMVQHLLGSGKRQFSKYCTKQETSEFRRTTDLLPPSRFFPFLPDHYISDCPQSWSMSNVRTKQDSDVTIQQQTLCSH